MEKNKLILLGIISIVVIIIIFGIVVIIHRFHNVDKAIFYDSANALSITNDGYVVIGSNNDNNFEKAKITVYDFSNEKKIEKVYNKGYNSTYYNVANVGDGYIAVGSYESTKSELRSGNRTAFIVKYDLDGNVLLEKEFDVLGNSKFTSVVTMNNEFIVCGQSIYNKITSSEEGTAILMKYDKDGNELWRKIGGESSTAIYKDLILLDNYIYVVGLDNENMGIIAKYDLDGNLINDKYYDGVTDIGFTGIDSFDNSLYVTGSKRIDNKNIAVILQYDLDLNIVNDVIYSGSSDTTFNNLAIDDTGNIIAIGTIFVGNEKKHSYDGVIGKYNNQLKELSVVDYTSDREVILKDIKIDNDKYLVVGNSIKDDNSVSSKIITLSTSLKILGVN